MKIGFGKMGLKKILICTLLIISLQDICHAQGKSGELFDRQVKDVLARINPPFFPEKTFNVDVKTADHFQKEINKAIEICNNAGGGQVVVPKGDYLCNGPIRMLSNVNLHLSDGALIRFGTNPGDYLPVVKVRWEGTVCYNYSPMIYAVGQNNIAITGRGTLDGQADKFWFAWKKQPNRDDQEKAKTILRKMGETGVAENERVFGAGYKLRPTLIEFYECESILLDGFTVRQSPFWTVHPVFSKSITIRNLTIGHGTTNDDGIDPDSCEDVLIEHCKINTDDDPISIKAGRDQDAWHRKGTRNVVVRNCTLQSAIANAFCIGSEMSGGVENVWVDNCFVPDTDMGVTLKANMDRGGFIRNLWVRNITIDSCRQAAIRIQMDYHSYRGGNFPPNFDQITFENINVRAARDHGWWLAGVASKSIGSVTMRNIKVDHQGKGNRAEFVNLKID
nr:glycoside hydrolase family 28 protein [uncultured Dyadobacter sp.]